MAIRPRLPDAHVVDGLGVVQLLGVGVVREPRVVPVVDPVEVGRVVEPVVPCEKFQSNF